MSTIFFRWCFVTTIVLFCGPVAALASPLLTYHGRLMTAAGDSVVSSQVDFRVRIYSPGPERCLLYDEQYRLDMSVSGGAFALNIGAGDSTLLSANTETIPREKIFRNQAKFTFAGGKCASGYGEYMPGASDGRLLQVSFNDNSFLGWEDLPEQRIGHVPLAIESMSVGGFQASDLLRVVDGSGDPVAVPALTPAQHTELLALLGGTSLSFAPVAHSHSVDELTSGSGEYFGYQPNGAACTPGQVLKWQNSRWECGTDVGISGAVTSVSVTAPLVNNGDANAIDLVVTDASASAKGVVRLASSSDTSAGLVVQANDPRLSDSRTPTAHGHVVDEIASASGKYFLYRPNGAACGANQILKWVNDRWECANDAEGLISESDPSVAAFAKNAPSADFSTPSDTLTLNTVGVAKGGTGLTATGSANQILGTNAAGNAFEHKTLAAGSGITITHAPNSVTISSSGGAESTSVQNVGAGGVGLYKQMSGTAIQLKNINAGAGSGITITNDTANDEVDIGVNTELAGLAGLSTNGFIKRTGAGAYSPASAIGYADLLTTAIANNTGLVISNGTSFENKGCSVNQVLVWLSPSGWTCSSAVLSESDPKVGANTANALSKWNGLALVASAVFEDGGSVGIGTASPSQALEVAGNVKISGTGNGLMFPDGTVLTTASLGGGGGVDTQTFDYTGSPQTWTKPASLSVAFIQCWGGGGGGARSTNRAGGGGGGASVSRIIPLAILGSTETVVIGAGGAGTAANANGGNGGNSTFGSWVTAYGGGGGLSNGSGGGGGGTLGPGNGAAVGPPLAASAGVVGCVWSDSEGNCYSGVTSLAYLGGEGQNANGSGGAGGASYSLTAGHAVEGGAGGGGCLTTTARAAGTSVQGGQGGAANCAGGVATDGGAPGGGGGGSRNGTSGAGGAGRCRIISW